MWTWRHIFEKSLSSLERASKVIDRETAPWCWRWPGWTIGQWDSKNKNVIWPRLQGSRVMMRQLEVRRSQFLLQATFNLHLSKSIYPYLCFFICKTGIIFLAWCPRQIMADTSPPSDPCSHLCQLETPDVYLGPCLSNKNYISQLLIQQGEARWPGSSQWEVDRNGVYSSLKREDLPYATIMAGAPAAALDCAVTMQMEGTPGKEADIRSSGFLML